MPTYFQRPENALKRANEFIDVGKKQRALDALYDVIKSKKHRTWQKIHEPIMEKYLDLCVDLKKSHVAKEGLYQYKTICQQVNIKSLDDIIRGYLALAERKTEEARKASHQAVIDVDDLDVIQTPESLLLSAVSGEDTQDRTDRAILTPWVKFLWESYRQCLDLLRNNNKVEKLYQDIAQQAFKFCLNYQRKTEFRKLCDNLRTHLTQIQKHQHQATAINLSNPESQQMHLETRLVQLDSAVTMELWQEAFKAVEDIHGLIALSKKSPKPSLMANYYTKLGLVFWKSNSQLFHACALHRLFHLTREQRKNVSKEEMERMASRVLCATLAIPIPASRNQMDTLVDLDVSAIDKQRKLATLLGLNTPPTRMSLVKDLMKYSVLQYVAKDLQELYNWLEVEFHPLKLSGRVANSLEFIKKNEELSPYVTAIEHITITRLIKQVSQVYQTISFKRLAELAPFASKFQLEKVVVHAARKLELQMRIDHQSQSLSFGTDLGVSQKEDVPEGPYLQSMPSEQIRNQLTAMANALHKACQAIQPKQIKSHQEDLKNHIVQSYHQTAKRDHVKVLQRRQIIEDRKEELESINVQKEKEEYEQEMERVMRLKDAENARLEREAEERERQRLLEEHREIKRKHAKERLEQLKKTDIGAKILEGVDEEELVDLDADDIVAMQVEQLEREKKELQDRLKAQEKKVDFAARARRIEEIPLLEKFYVEEKVELKDFWEQQESERITQTIKEREVAIDNKDRMQRMLQDSEKFIKNLRDARSAVFKDKLADFNKKFNTARKKRLAERKEQRKEERRRKYLEDKEEAAQKARDEQLKREREEKERMEQEKREEEEKAYKDKLAKLEEITKKQKEREREIEEREAKKREMNNRPEENAWNRGSDSKEPDRPAVKEGGWREREREKEQSWKPESRGESERWERRDDRPPAIDSGAWRRDRDDKRRDRDDKTDDRGPPRDDRSSRDFRGRDDDHDWRGGGQGQGQSNWGRDGDGSGSTYRDRDDQNRGGGSSWREDKGRDRGGPPPDRDWGPRDRDRDRGPPPSRDYDDRGPPSSRDREDRGPPSDWRRGETRDSWRDRDRDVDRDGPRRDDRDRGPPSRGMDDGPWRQSGSGYSGSRDDRFKRDDRGDDRFKRDDRGDDRGRRDEGAWQRGAPTPGDDWRQGRDKKISSPPSSDSRHGLGRQDDRGTERREDDGWKTVSR